MSDLWLKIPAPLRTIVNVALGALLAWAATDGLNLLGSSDLDPVWKGLLVAVATAVVRSLNPADTGYGLGAEPTD